MPQWIFTGQPFSLRAIASLFDALFICCYIKVEKPGLLFIVIVQMVCKADAVQPFVDC